MQVLPPLSGVVSSRPVPNDAPASWDASPLVTSWHGSIVTGVGEAVALSSDGGVLVVCAVVPEPPQAARSAAAGPAMNASLNRDIRVSFLDSGMNMEGG